nr:probable E3 ubiquitin-protein ligase MID2 isoform X1 [Crassostrea virginica]
MWEDSFQDVVRCHICEEPLPNKHCLNCEVNFCESCEGEHCSQKASVHTVVPFESGPFAPKCSKHFKTLCDQYCENCSTFVCSVCISSEKHTQHKLLFVPEIVSKKKKVIEFDLQELVNSIYPAYQRSLLNFSNHIADMKKTSNNLKIGLKEQREVWIKEINIIFQNLLSDIDYTDDKNLRVLQKQADAVENALGEMEKIIKELKILKNTYNILHVSNYKSKIKLFKRIPDVPYIRLPNFRPKKIVKEQLFEQFDILSSEFLDEPKIISNILTDAGRENGFRCISCLDDKTFWITGWDSLIRLYNVQGELLASFQTKSGNTPWDLTVTQNGDVVYSDSKDKSINIWNKIEAKELYKLQNWIPHGVCSSINGDILVIMNSEECSETKVVRYSNFKAVQTIQWDNVGQPLYSSGSLFKYKYLCENRNMDICVADNYAKAVVVVSAKGNIRFRYTGHLSATKVFYPNGITSDSNGKILVVDTNNSLIHILDQDGQFIRYIENCGLRNPWGICADTKDNLAITELITGKVKKIQYYSKTKCMDTHH